METLDHDHTIHTQRGAGDDKLFVTFHQHYMLNEEKTANEGRPIYDDMAFIRIVTPGNRDTIIDRPVRPEDKFRFPKQHAAFVAGEEGLAGATRLEEWTPMPRSMVEELRYFGFRSVEHVADANDQVLSKMPGLREWSARAKAFLIAAKDSSAITRAEAANSALQSQIDTLKATVEELSKLKAAPEGATALPTGKK